jgi:hypothetical protein
MPFSAVYNEDQAERARSRLIAMFDRALAWTQSAHRPAVPAQSLPENSCIQIGSLVCPIYRTTEEGAMSVESQLRWIALPLLSLTPLLASAQGGAALDDSLVVAIVGIAVGFGVVLILGIIALSMLAPYLAQRRHAQLIEKFVEQGREIPPELTLGPPKPGPADKPMIETAGQRRTRLTRRGVVLLAWAAGIAVVFYLTFEDPRASAWGLLFLCLAIASFINGWFFSEDNPPD